ncbi:MAG: hypothetical protein JO252_26820 [Planctomycetaceae bacterium]|nr:hypothetical protein [Planctomycetaceae bacterium]
MTISSRQLNRLAVEVGHQLESLRNQQVEALRNQQLTPTVATRPAVAVVQVDGGRIRIRGQGDGPGAHKGAWREDKFALLATAAITVSSSDPEPDLPDCFHDRAFVEGLVRGIAGQGPLSGPNPLPESPASPSPPDSNRQNRTRNRPELLVRTYVASMCPSEEFGPMVAVEARKRNFEKAAHRVFVGDGSAWIWGLQKQYFPTFQTVVDFLHVLGHLFAAAKAAATTVEERWMLFQRWTEDCWKGRVGQVLAALQTRQTELGPVPEDRMNDLADDDPRKVLAQELGYLERNQSRMDYPTYRQQGLPWTSSHIESTVKIFNRRVKGSEKFWGQTGAEAILQLRAAFLSEDDRLRQHLRARPCSPFRSYKVRGDRKAA